MSDRIDTYEITGDAHLVVEIHSGDIRLKEGDRGRVTVQISGSSDALDNIVVDAASDTVTVRSTARRKRWFVGGSIDMVVTLPPGAHVALNLGSGDVQVGLATTDLEVNIGSGDVRIDDVARTTDIKVGSGDIRCGRLNGTTRISSASGDVRLDSATDLTVTTAAGDMHVGEVSESARLKSATGNVRVGKFSGTDLEIKTMSGDAHVGIVPGMVVKTAIKTMSGDFRNRIKPSSGERIGTMNLAITSFTGDVVLTTAK
ncbi:MAG TPA: DUF4097 family beta strand repeat-containing protein [Acidimicrobiia bacterium]|nr:DUF4097 family beta strand repeat-containing protein [Acidimicrobiia bacterium]